MSIDFAIQTAVMQRLKAGLKPSDIAREMSIHRDSVRNIKARHSQVSTERIVRCPDCGGSIYVVPCVLCAARDFRKPERIQ